MIKPPALIVRFALLGTLIALGGTISAQTYTAVPLSSSSIVSQYPYNFTGLIRAATGSSAYLGSGAVARNPRVVYSCAHVVFDAKNLSLGSDPWLSEVRWNRAWYSSNSPSSTSGQLLRGYFYFVGYSNAAAVNGNSLSAFDLDFVVHYAYENTAAGGYAGTWTDGVAQLKGSGSKLITGYPSGLYASGDTRKFLMHATGPFSRAFQTLYDDYLGANELSTGPGNSGGPVWVSDGTDYYLAGVLVSGSERSLGNSTDSAGVYGIDSSSLALIDGAITAGGGAVAAPVITSQPVSRRVNVGQSVSFSVTASGQGLGYRWLKNGVTITGAASASYPIASATLADAGSYQVIVNNSGGEARSEIVILAVDSAPLISSPPMNVTVPSGERTQLKVLATGAGILTYQWYQGQSGNTASPVAGATTAVLTTPTLTATISYWVRVTDGNGGITNSPTATVTVSATSPLNVTQQTLGSGYPAGGAVVVTNTITYTGAAPGRIDWATLLPAGWKYLGSGGSEGGARPVYESGELLEWVWTTVPASPIKFTYTVSVPAGTTGDQVIASLVTSQASGTNYQTMAKPDPLVLRSASMHTADSNRDGKISLTELTRVIELYNYRSGTTRTGQYKPQSGTEDGFAAGPP
jgi:hypothetical protein